MRTLNFRSYKGGQGATSLMCAFALYMAQQNRTVAVKFSPDAHATLGIPTVIDDPVVEHGCTFLPPKTNPPDNIDWFVSDDMTYTETVLVVRNDYVALRNTLRHDHLEPLGYVAYIDPLRPLQPDDVQRCMDVPMLGNITLDPSIARSIDAGMYANALTMRLHHALPIIDACKSIALHVGVNGLMQP